MYTLYLDTHSNAINIVLYQDDTLLIKKEIVTEQNQSTTTIPVLIEVLETAKIDITRLKEIIVVNGPGSFTGIRIGVTIAKTLAYTLNIPIKTLTSLEIKAVSIDHDIVRIIEREKNGVFLGTFDAQNQRIGDYTYLKTSEYQKEDMDKEDIQMDYEKIKKYTNSLKPLNPHQVNPLYVKKIEVQK